LTTLSFLAFSIFSIKVVVPYSLFLPHIILPQQIERASFSTIRTFCKLQSSQEQKSTTVAEISLESLLHSFKLTLAFFSAACTAKKVGYQTG